MAIAYEDFAKLELRVGKITAASRVEGADRLLRLEVAIGDTEKRELAAGIAKDYAPEELVGKTVVVLANIAPRQVRGISSNGMVLAAVDGAGKAVLLTTDKPLAPGAKVF